MHTERSMHPVYLILCIAPLIFWPGALNATEEETPELPMIAHPAWSPDGNHIAFQSDHITGNCEIWMIHPDGTNLERVTTNAAEDLEPKWGPDSSSLYFLSFRTGKRRLWNRVLSSGIETQVTQLSVADYAVSHGGNEVILETGVIGGIDLGVISAATGQFDRWVAASSDGEGRPTWSPNDQEAAFFKGGNIWARNATDRSNMRQLTNFTAEDRLMGTLDWGSSGFIAFDMDGKIYKVRPDGTDLTCIFQDTDPPGWSENPSWSPDGSKIVFVRSFGDFQDLYTINADGTGLTQVTHQVAEPTFSPDGGTYGSEQSVTISCATGGATVRYTTDGTDPTESSTVYSTPITVDHNLTLKAKGWKTDYFPSSIKTADYILKVATPTFDPDGGTYHGTQHVTISCATGGATIHYTTDGTDPTESSPVYTSRIKISSTTTLKARGFKSGWTESDIKSAEYIIQ